MRALIVFLVVFGTTNAGTPLEPSPQLAFTNVFRQALFFEVSDAYNTALADKESLEADSAQCNETVNQAMAACTAEAKSKCAPGTWEKVELLFEYGWAETDQFFTEVVWGNFVDNIVWDSIGSFVVNDAGNFFAGTVWEGWGGAIESFAIDMGGWFEGIGQDIGSWFSSWTRKKRSLGHGQVSNQGVVALINRLRNLREHGSKAARANWARSQQVSRRDELTSEQRDCMEKCPSCDPFLGDTAYLLDQLCAAQDLLTRNATLAADLEKIMWIVTAANNTVDLIVVETQTDGAFDYATYTLAETWITAKFPTGDQYYQSAEAYQLMDSSATAAACGVEYWTKYDQY